PAERLRASSNRHRSYEPQTAAFRNLRTDRRRSLTWGSSAKIKWMPVWPALPRGPAEPIYKLRGAAKMFIQTEATPNPATLKFLPGRVVMAEGTFEARDAAEAERSPLAKALMELPGVSGVFFANDFISVTKTEGEWQHLRPAVLGVVTEFFLSGEPLIASGGADAVSTGEFFDAKDSETVEAIKELIETRVRPAVAGDGGDIIFKGFRDGVVYLKMKGACSGCPSSTATLRHGIENLLKHFLPEV